MSLPKTLNDTYARILLTIDEEYSQDAFRILQWLAYSARPLRIEELAEVVAINLVENSPADPGMRLQQPRDIFSICSSLITSSEVDEIEYVRLAHFSVKEYLISDHIRTGPASFYSIVQSADNLIAQTCLVYLLQFKKFGLPASLDKDYPLARYAAEYWPQHIRKAEKEGSTTEIQGLCTEFLFDQTNAFRNSLQISGPYHNLPVDSLLNRYIHKYSMSPLCYASSVGLSQPIQKLIEANANIDFKVHNVSGNDILNALIIASFMGHEAIVQLLIITGIDVDSKSALPRNALEAASSAGHDSIIQRLLEVGANVNAGYALQQASSNGYGNIVHRLLKAGANVDAQDKNGDALQAASLIGSKPVVQQLLEAGANVNAVGGSFGNALQAASAWGRDNEVIQILLNTGANVNTQGGF